MLRARQRHTDPPVLLGWLLIAALYLTAAVLGAFLAAAVAGWWPLILTIASVLAAAQCIQLGLARGTVGTSGFAAPDDPVVAPGSANRGPARLERKPVR